MKFKIIWLDGNEIKSIDDLTLEKLNVWIDEQSKTS